MKTAMRTVLRTLVFPFFLVYIVAAVMWDGILPLRKVLREYWS
jgi:hypothetical protein